MLRTGMGFIYGMMIKGNLLYYPPNIRTAKESTTDNPPTLTLAQRGAWIGGLKVFTDKMNEGEARRS